MVQQTIVFAMGLFLMLIIPIVLALVLARYCRVCRSDLYVKQSAQLELEPEEIAPSSDVEDNSPLPIRRSTKKASKRPRRKMLAGRPARGGTDEEEGQCEPMCPQSCEVVVPHSEQTKPLGAGSSGFTTVCFRKSEWRSRLQKPLVMGVRVGFVKTVAELSVAVRDAYKQACKQGQVEGDSDLGAITIECQFHDGEMLGLLPDMAMVELSAVKALFVTTNISQAAVIDSFGASLLATPSYAESEEEPDELIDMKQREAELSRFRAAKFRHYFTM
ncbi:MAG: hypothetical protein SGPRY_012509 [Prymnesium sp.]